MMNDEEIDDVVWEQKRQRAIKNLQELPRGQHFAVITSPDEDDHDKHQTIVVGCLGFVAACSRHIQEILFKTMFGVNNSDS